MSDSSVRLALLTIGFVNAQAAERIDPLAACEQTDIAACVSKVQGTCSIHPAASEGNTGDPLVATRGAPVRAGDKIECPPASAVTLTFCASRADVYVQHDSERARYLVPNVPARRPPEQDLLPALRQAQLAPSSELQQLFAEGLHPARDFQLPERSKTSTGLFDAFKWLKAPAEEQRSRRLLETWAEQVHQDQSHAFRQLSSNEGKFSYVEVRDDRRYTYFTFCAAPDGRLTAPQQLQGIDIQTLTDARGQPVGTELYTLAAPGTVAKLKSKWQWGDMRPIDVTTYFTKVGDQLCGVNEQIQPSKR